MPLFLCNYEKSDISFYLTKTLLSVDLRLNPLNVDCCSKIANKPLALLLGSLAYKLSFLGIGALTFGVPNNRAKELPLI